MMTPPTRKKEPLPKEIVKQKLRERKKLSKQMLKEKRARLLVKNLSFKVTEENLKEFFGQYGEIVNVNLLKKPDGKLVGCGFIQFNLVQKAAKARHHTNGKEFFGRKIEVDFAKPKNKYKQPVQHLNSDNKPSPVDLNISSESAEDGKIEIDSNSEHSDKQEASDSENSDKEEETSESENDEIRSDVQENRNTQENSWHFSNDVSEGKTIFVKNVPFDATNDDLKNCMSQFGRIYYALICVDKLTEHSKGTAFVKFLDKEDADKALNAGTELSLLGNILDCHPAIDRNQLQTKMKDKMALKTQSKDSRNLYLVKEGVIPAGSTAAEGVSVTDMTKRAQIERYKTQMLRNLNMFVAKERLVVHNLPSSWDDKKLATLFQKYGGPGAVVKEARIMRDRKNVDDNGVGISKQYGFVAFTRHDNALAALRNLNNNPNIFSEKKRPIIVFSIENRAAILAKQKRLEKSKIQNQNKKKEEVPKTEKKNNKSKKFKRFLEKRKLTKKKMKTTDGDLPTKFSGVRTDKK